MFSFKKYLKDLFYKHVGSKFELYVPSRVFDGMMTFREYALLADICLDYFAEKEMKVIRARNGALIIEGENGLQYHFQLDKLVYMLKDLSMKSWKRHVYAHFNSIKCNPKAYLYIFKDLDFSTEYLRIFSNLDPTMTEEQKKELIHFPRGRFDDYLVLYFEEHFRFIRSDEIAEWDTTVKYLHQIALENTLAEMIDDEPYYTHEETEQGVTTKPIYYAKADWINLSVIPVAEPISHYHTHPRKKKN